MFKALIKRSTTQPTWQKIPWHDPDFSRRMLAEHLNQDHDMASRRQSTIDQQVEWIQRKVLRATPAAILDLGCGPGFYARRFSAMGHQCTGLDFSPASIQYAREQDGNSTYQLGNILELDYGSEYDMVMLIFGEFNAFAPEEAARIVDKAYQALKTGGRLLLEVHTAAFIHRIGHEGASWYTNEKGLFSDEAYICLTESRYESDHAITMHYVIDAVSGAIQPYVNMLQGYTDDEYRRLLGAFKQVMFYPSLTGNPDPADLFVIVAEK